MDNNNFVHGTSLCDKQMLIFVNRNYWYTVIILGFSVDAKILTRTTTFKIWRSSHYICTAQCMPLILFVVTGSWNHRYNIRRFINQKPVVAVAVPLLWPLRFKLKNSRGHTKGDPICTYVWYYLIWFK